MGDALKRALAQHTESPVTGANASANERPREGPVPRASRRNAAAVGIIAVLAAMAASRTPKAGRGKMPESTTGCWPMRFTVCAALTSAVVALAWPTLRRTRLARETLQKQLARTLELQAQRPTLTAAALRSKFDNTELPVIKPNPVVPHPASAARRSAASRFVDRLAMETGLTSYFVQSSQSDKRKRRRGHRTQYWFKDFTADGREDGPSPRDLVALIDVDYYVDMNSLLSTNFKPTLLYTIIPTTAGCVRDDFSYTFNGDNIVMSVDGGGKYEHSLWDWTRDDLVVRHTFLGITYSLACYSVARKACSEDRELVLCAPVAKWTGLWAFLAHWCITGTYLRRMRFSEGRFTRVKVYDGKSMKVSTAYQGSHDSATLLEQHDAALAAHGRVYKTALSVPTTMSYLETANCNIQDVRAQAVVLTDYHLSKEPKRPLEPVFAATHHVRAYDYGPPAAGIDARVPLVAFMAPLIDGAFCPVNSLYNEQVAVNSRVTAARDQAAVEDIKMTNFLETTMVEFLEHFMPDARAHTLHPVGADEVMERQHKPSQRAILHRAEAEQDVGRYRTFIKAEAYANVKDPRIITTLPPSQKARYSAYIYALADYMKDGAASYARWYAFGRTPLDIAGEVAGVCKRAPHGVMLTDFSRFDSRVTSVLRTLERRLLIRAFSPAYHEELFDLHSSTFNASAACTLGTRYESEYARLSGEAATSAFNSVINAYVAFLAMRSTASCGAYMTATEAYASIGIYGGDDGLTPVVPGMAERTYTRAAASVGLRLTISHVARGRPGVMFLARRYGPDVWHGDVNSMCDLMRQLAKFHTTCNLPPNVTPLMKLQEKARSFLLGDANTPIIGTYCRAVAALSSENGTLVARPETESMRAWQSDADSENHYPNEDAGWMTHEASIALETVGFDYDHFDRWLHYAYGERRVEVLLEPPQLALRVPVDPGVAVTVDETTHSGTRKDNTVTKRKVKQGRWDPPGEAKAASRRHDARTGTTPRGPKMNSRERRARGRAQRFDATKGYPGEGPGAWAAAVDVYERSLKKMLIALVVLLIIVGTIVGHSPANMSTIRWSDLNGQSDHAHVEQFWAAYHEAARIASGRQARLSWNAARRDHVGNETKAGSRPATNLSFPKPIYAEMPRAQPGASKPRNAATPRTEMPKKQTTPDRGAAAARPRSAPPPPRKPNRKALRSKLKINNPKLRDHSDDWYTNNTGRRRYNASDMFYDIGENLAHKGRRAASSLTNAAEDYLGKIIGHGDYGVSAPLIQLQNNSLFGTRSSSGTPVFGQTETVRVKHRFFWRDVVSHTGFHNATLPVQPGMMPWLNAISTRYEMYRFHGLVFEYLPRSYTAVAGSDPSTGSVVLVCNMDPTAPAFKDKTTALAYMYSVSGSPFDAVINGMECAPKSQVLNAYYNRGATVPFGEDPRFYDTATFQLITEGMQTEGDVIGELWISLDVEFMYPRIDEVAASGRAAVYVGYYVTSSNPLDNAAQISGDADLLTLPNDGNDTVLFNTAGKYLVNLDFKPSATGTPVTYCRMLGNPTAVGTAVLTPGSAPGFTWDIVRTPAGTAETVAMMHFVIEINKAGDGFDLTGVVGANLSSSTMAMALTVTSIPMDLCPNPTEDKQGMRILNEMRKYAEYIERKEVDEEATATAKYASKPQRQRANSADAYVEVNNDGVVQGLAEQLAVEEDPVRIATLQRLIRQALF